MHYTAILAGCLIEAGVRLTEKGVEKILPELAKLFKDADFGREIQELPVGKLLRQSLKASVRKQR